MRVTRRDLLASGAALTGLGVMPGMAAMALKPPRYIRHDVASPDGQRMLRGYAKAIEVMLAKPATHPHNWFRNAFVHYMDCPHGNWWFYVWHRGYVGFVEQTIRKYSGMADFAFPYWDWTTQQRLPATMFDGVLTPVAQAFSTYAKDLPTFTAFIQPALQTYYNGLNRFQMEQQKLRGNTDFGKLWDGVAGTNGVDIGDRAFAATDRSRYPTAANPDLVKSVADLCAPEHVALGLQPTLFNSPSMSNSFTSRLTASHNAMPTGSADFSLLEGDPHNKVHNFIGGAFQGPGNWGDGPFGNMTNNLSPVDPIFFLHHSNMDRLWWIWEGKQLSLGLPTLPTDPQTLAQFKSDPFLFFWTADGQPVLDGKAGDYINPARFDYRYAEPVGQDLIKLVTAMKQKPAPTPLLLASAPSPKAVDDLSDWSVGTGSKQLLAIISFTRPENSAREYTVLLNAPPDVKSAGPDSPYYTGAITFFGGHMPNMGHRYRYIVALKRDLVAKAGGHLDLRLAAPSNKPDAPVPVIEALEIRGV